ncbi:glycosyltransferase family 2 protein [Ramaria rubella]|nr:glycosyltransferase family 2 protein [Ramaria rubella]
MPSYPSQSSQPGDPFSDRAPRPQGPYDALSYSSQTAYAASNVSLPGEFGAGRSYPPQDEEEKLPLTRSEAYPGNYYPPTGPVDTTAYGAPFERPSSTVSSSADGAWRRRQTIKRGVTRKVKLTGGNFIAEYAVPTAVRNAVEPKWAATNSTEFTHMRYSAATVDPDDFTPANGWSLRTSNYNRPTELLIAVTSYNEDKLLYSRTLHNVMLNIRDICKTKSSKYWKRTAEEGIPGWQRVTVALIVDGLEAMDKSVLDILATVGVYQDGIMKKQVDGKDTVAHIFEYTTQVSVDTSPQLILPHGDDPNNLVPVQIIFVLKAKNQKKINSHRWLFNAIGKYLQPEICVLLDAGTKPGHKAIYYLWEAFYNDPHLGGACGEIHAMIKGGKKLLNPLIAAQNFEYKACSLRLLTDMMSNILDKPLESSFGYVSVLPGAFSAYRYKAILGRPLEQYFHGDHSLADRLGPKGINGMGIFEKNMFLAEDRILCFELAAKANERWVLNYVKPSKAETDVPESAAELISQRRRWLNGSFAASIYSLYHFFRLYKSGHGIIRMFFFHIQALYNVASLVFSWFALANLWLTFSLIIDLTVNQGIKLFGTAGVTHWVNLAFKWVYLAFLALQFVLALGNRPKGERLTYAITLWVYAFLSLYLIVCSIDLTVHSFEGLNFKDDPTVGDKIHAILTGPAGVLLAALVSTFGIYFFASFLYRDPWHMFSSFPQYLLLAPSFTNVINVYAFCNLHDVSWGTKGSDKAEALPSVSSKKGKEDQPAIVEDVTKVQEDVDVAFKETVQRAVTKIKSEETIEKPTVDDENKTFRTRLVAFWMLSNAALAVSIENLNGLPDENNLEADQAELVLKQNRYFEVILWSTFALAVVRFAGCLFYFFKRNLFRCCRRN